jgi:hypothetical protein
LEVARKWKEKNKEYKKKMDKIYKEKNKEILNKKKSEYYKSPKGRMLNNIILIQR